MAELPLPQFLTCIGILMKSRPRSLIWSIIILHYYHNNNLGILSAVSSKEDSSFNFEVKTRKIIWKWTKVGTNERLRWSRLENWRNVEALKHNFLVRWRCCETLTWWHFSLSFHLWFAVHFLLPFVSLISWLINEKCPS